MSDCSVPSVRAMDATSSPTRWGSTLALELRSDRLLLPGLLQRSLLQKAGLRLLAACAYRSSVRQVQMLRLHVLPRQVDSLRSSCSRLGPEGSLCFRLLASVRQDLRMQRLLLRLQGGVPCWFRLLSLPPPQVELGPAPVCLPRSVLDSVLASGHSDSAVASV